MTIPMDFTEEFEKLILSVSGFRKIFGESEDSFSCKVRETNSLIAGVIIYGFCLHLKEWDTQKSILIATDSRPTGPSLAECAAKIFNHFSIPFIYIGIASAPEAMAFSALSDDLDGFCYISASHNPVGHNGFKFGRSSGGVMGAEDASAVIGHIKSIALNPNQLITIQRILEDGHVTLTPDADNKNESLESYTQFLIATAFNSNETIIDQFNRELKNNPIGVIAELNGSARSVSSDRRFFSTLGIKAEFYNDTPGNIVHGIVPEGDNLQTCRDILERRFTSDQHFLIGYVPDNDGDRGNIAYIDESIGRARILKAQEVFALSVLSELLYLRYLSAAGIKKINKTAVVVNGPTSMRIDDICRSLGVDLFRAEVGEANVVNLARIKRSEGYTVRIFGEGSNGGNITYPAAVRDPLNTIMSFIKLLRLSNPKKNSGLFEDWFQIIERPCPGTKSLQSILQTLPVYSTTDAYEDYAKMNVSAASHSKLKNMYETLLESMSYPFPDSLINAFGEIEYTILNYEGIDTLPGKGNRTGDGRGGFKLLLSKKDTNESIGFVWMRGSGTEPVFRVMVDLKTDSTQIERDLLEWHRTMVTKADRLSGEI